MKAVVINYTGTVGKTTICANLLVPRMVRAKFFAIESINETAEGLGIDVNKYRGDMFRDVFKSLLVEDSAIIDVGASNVEEFMQHMTSFDGSHEEIDYFIVPVTSGTKEQKETISMIKSLALMGVSADRIRIVFNRVHRDVVDEFPAIINFHAESNKFWLDLECAVYETELFDALSLHRTSLDALLADNVDYKTLLKDKEASPADRNRWSDMYGLKLLSKGINGKLNVVFDKLFA
jgi:hypothetical protein